MRATGRGIGLVNLVGQPTIFLPLDYRIYALEQDQKTKNDHFPDLFEAVVAEGQVRVGTLVFDFWYAGSTPLKSNRLVSVTKETGYQGLDTLEPLEPPPPQGGSHGLEVGVKEVPLGLKLFRLAATNGDVQWVITPHSVAHLSREMVIDAVKVRWQAEELHRRFRQLTGAGKCQCRKARAQRSHLQCGSFAWVWLRQHARSRGQSLYQGHQQQWAPCLRKLLQKPSSQALVYLKCVSPMTKAVAPALPQKAPYHCWRGAFWGSAGAALLVVD